MVDMLPVATGGKGLTDIVRPKTIDDIVGLREQKTILHYALGGAKARNEPFPSFLLAGVSGGGKTTLARIVANMIGGEVHRFLGSDLTSPDEIYSIAAKARDNDVIYIEEAHNLAAGKKGKIVQALLYEWIEDCDLSGASVYGINVTPKVVWLLATTNPGRLAEPLRNRLRRIDIGYYSQSEMEEILRRAGVKCNLNLAEDKKALTLLAQSSRATPRIAIMNRLDGLLSFMAVDKVPYSFATVQRYLYIHGISPYGLEKNDIDYCKVLYGKMVESAKPVGRKTLIQTLGLEDDYVDQIIEKYLNQIGFISIVSNGRILTEKGCAAIGVIAPITKTWVTRKTIDVEKLKALIANPAVRAKGIKGLADEFDIQYSNSKERDLLKQAVESIGFRSIQRIGLVKVDEEKIKTA